MITLGITHPRRGRYELHDPTGRLAGALTIGWPLRRGEITTPTGSWPLCRRGFTRVTVGTDPADPVARLDKHRLVMPGTGLDAHVVYTHRPFRGFRAELAHQDATMAVALPVIGFRSQVRIGGHWPDRDLITLTAHLSLLLRRQRLAIATN